MPSPSNIRAPLSIGMRIGSYTVVRTDNDLLELRGHRGRGATIIICGLLAALFGALPWLAWARGSHEYISLHDLAIGPIGCFAIFAGIAEINSRLSFSGTERAVYQNGLFGKRPPTPAVMYDSVFIESLPTNLEQREKLAIKILPADPKRMEMPLLIGSLRTNKPSAIQLLCSAVEIASLLDLPIKVSGACREGDAYLQKALGDLDTTRND